VAAIQEALAPVVAAEVTVASRDATVDGIAVTEGQYLAIVDGRAFATGDDLWTVLDALLGHFAGQGLSLVNAYRGEDAPDEGEVSARIEQHGLEAAVLWGGQPHYPLLLSAE
jgi:dihydroxyacetone kinase-like predicted kinase